MVVQPDRPLFFHIEGAHLVPELRFAAPYAGMTCADGPVGALIPLDLRAVVVGLRPFASHFEQAPAFGRAGISEFLDDFPGLFNTIA